jgi:hypothetical protein
MFRYSMLFICRVIVILLVNTFVLILSSYCGTGTTYCAAPDCQFLYGPLCDANRVPSGASTASIARPLLGSVPYGGTPIYDCVVPGGGFAVVEFSLLY